MSAEKLNLAEWQTRYAAEEACEQALAQQRWPQGLFARNAGMTKHLPRSQAANTL